MDIENNINTNSTNIDKIDDIYATISFEELDEILVNETNINNIKKYIDDQDLYPNEKKDAIVIYSNKEKNSCDDLKKQIEEKQKAIKDKEEYINKRQSEVPEEIEKIAKDTEKKLYDLTVLQSVLDGVKDDSSQYDNIKSKMEEMKNDIRENGIKEKELVEEKSKIVNSIKDLDNEKKSCSNIISKYNNKVQKFNDTVKDFKGIEGLIDFPEKIENTKIENIQEQQKNESVVHGEQDIQNPQQVQNFQPNEQGINNPESVTQNDQMPNKEKTALTDPKKENKIKKFFKNVKEKIKYAFMKATGKIISDEQAAKIEQNKEYITKLMRIDSVSLEDNKEFKDSLKQMVNTEEEQVKQMEKDGREKARDIDERDYEIDDNNVLA